VQQPAPDIAPPSAGVAAYPVDAPDIDHLLRMADVAMLAANAAGGNTFRFYFPDADFLSGPLALLAGAFAGTSSCALMFACVTIVSHLPRSAWM